MEALILMNTGKAAEPSGVTVELSNVCKKESVRRLAEVANNMLEGNKMPKVGERVIGFQFLKEKEM